MKWPYPTAWIRCGETSLAGAALAGFNGFDFVSGHKGKPLFQDVLAPAATGSQHCANYSRCNARMSTRGPGRLISGLAARMQLIALLKGFARWKHRQRRRSGEECGPHLGRYGDSRTAVVCGRSMRRAARAVEGRGKAAMLGCIAGLFAVRWLLTSAVAAHVLLLTDGLGLTAEEAMQ